MAKADQLFRNIINDVRVNLSDEFDRNFERKAFFDRPWSTDLKWSNHRGSMMMRSGNLRNSINSRIEGSSIVWESSLPYAKIHNEGGEITVTNKMKKFAWAMYYKASGAVRGNSQRDQILSQEAQQWKALALKKVGSKIKIEQRQFIGDHPQVKVLVKEAIGNNLKDLQEYIRNTFKQK